MDGAGWRTEPRVTGMRGKNRDLNWGRSLDRMGLGKGLKQASLNWGRASRFGCFSRKERKQSLGAHDVLVT